MAGGRISGSLRQSGKLACSIEVDTDRDRSIFTSHPGPLQKSTMVQPKGDCEMANLADIRCADPFQWCPAAGNVACLNKLANHVLR